MDLVVKYIRAFVGAIFAEKSPYRSIILWLQ